MVTPCSVLRSRPGRTLALGWSEARATGSRTSGKSHSTKHWPPTWEPTSCSYCACAVPPVRPTGRGSGQTSECLTNPFLTRRVVCLVFPLLPSRDQNRSSAITRDHLSPSSAIPPLSVRVCSFIFVLLYGSICYLYFLLPSYTCLFQMPYSKNLPTQLFFFIVLPLRIFYNGKS